MFLDKPFFGLIPKRSPLLELLDHYEIINKGVELIRNSLECYIGGKDSCRDFWELLEEVDKVEEQADKVKRTIRNHLPISLLMPVDKVLFFNYTRNQDSILDDGQQALHWLAMRRIVIPQEYQTPLLKLVNDGLATATKLRPALEATVKFITGRGYSRKETKDFIRDVRSQHKCVILSYQAAVSAIYGSDMEFKDIYQLLQFCQGIHSMSHNTENCADLLRAMIAK